MGLPRRTCQAPRWARLALGALALAAPGCGEPTVAPSDHTAAAPDYDYWARPVRPVVPEAAVELRPPLPITDAALISSAVDPRSSLPPLIRLPQPDEPPHAAHAMPTLDDGAAFDDDVVAGPTLLPPVALAPPADDPAPGAWETADVDDEDQDVLPTPAEESLAVAPAPSRPVEPAQPPTLDDVARAFAAPPTDPLLAETSPVASGEPTGAKVSQRAQERIRQAYSLARRGAFFAARRELIEVLRMLAEAKDEKHGAARRTTALAQGLRALEEAEDFCVRGPNADSTLSVSMITAAHLTPVGKAPEVASRLPQQVADLYLRYAQVNLAAAVVGEPAGSMALHALGKIYSELGELEPDKTPLAARQGFALQHAALLARADNHLAAHELGVMLAEAGHYAEAEYLLSQVAAREPNAVVLRNLAQVQRKLGRLELAAATERQALEASGAAGHPAVRWVPPQTLAQTTDAVPPDPTRIAAAPPRPYAPAPGGGQGQPRYVR